MKLRRLTLLSVFVTVLFSVVAATAQSESKEPIQQLRIYEIPKENREVFHERFKNHALRIMKKYGFNIVAIWESETEGKLEFVYLLEWKDKQIMEESWKKFLADEEWKEIKKKSSEKYGTFVNAIQDRTLILVDYSPQKKLLRN